MNRTRQKKRALRSALFLLLAICIFSLALTGCDIVPLGGTAFTTTRSITPGNNTAPVTTKAVDIDQYLSPEIPSDAGTYAYVARVASPSVVSIVTEAIVYDQFYGNRIESGAGSGVIIHVDTEDGYTYIVTNHHVVEGYNTITVYPYDSANGYAAEVCGSDWLTDVAVVRIKATNFTAAEIGNSQELILGQEVAAIGNPLGVLGGTVTNGIISCLARTIKIEGISMTLIQHSAGVSPGNSGGALFNLYGQLVGIVNAKSVATGAEAIGYAIPIDLALERAVQIIEKGYVSNTPHLGLSYSQETNSGLVISGYEYNDVLTAANQDALKEGDILVSLNGKAVKTAADVRSFLSNCKVGDVLEANFKRRVATAAGPFTYYDYIDVNVNLKIYEYGSASSIAPPADDTASDGEMDFS